MSVEARLYHAEKQAEQLSQQVKLLKQLITTEVLDLRSNMEQQVAEVKQAVMYQDQLYQQRIETLEGRIQQLSEFCLRLARSFGQPYTSTSIISTEINDLPLPEYSKIEQNNNNNINATTTYDDIDEEDDEKTKNIKGILEKYKDKIDKIYDYYTTSAIDVFHPTMTMTHFSRFVKDCQLCGISQGTSSELLWIAVMRSLNFKQSKRVSDTQTQNRGIKLGNSISSKQKKKLFAYQRLETIPKDLFGETLNILAKEKRRQKQISEGITVNDSEDEFLLDNKSEEILITFLLYHVFPFTDAVMEEKQQQIQNSNSQLGISFNARDVDQSISIEAVSIQGYKTDAVKTVVKEYMGRIKDCFNLAIKTIQGYQTRVMNLDSFVEVARRYELLPLIRKPDLRHIFISCSNLEKEKHPEAEEGTISVGTFLLSLYYLAEKIYGDSLMEKRFPTPEARMKKLLTKMFLLS